MAEFTDIMQTKWLAYADIHTHANATAQTIANGASYVKVVNFMDNGPSLNATPDATNNQVTIGADGIYKIDGSFSFSATNNITSFGSMFVNGVEEESIHYTRKIGVAGDIGNSSFNGILSLSDGDVLDFRVRHTLGTPVDFTFSYMNLCLFRIDRG